MRRFVDASKANGASYLIDECIRCFANCYVTVQTRDGWNIEESYGMSWWKVCRR